MLGTAAHIRGFGLCVLSTVILVVALLPESGLSDKHVEKRGTKGPEWNYEQDKGPAHWKTLYNKYCAGGRQSPINIDTKDVDLNTKLDDFDFNDDYDEDIKDVYIKNNGHTVKVVPGDKEPDRTFTNGGMDDTYEFEELHFHWGSDSKKGSEHTINGKQYPLEMHLVHRNTRYDNMDEAKTKEDGIAVLAVLFKVGDEDNDALEDIIDKLDEVRKEGETAEIDEINLEDLLPDDLMPYYRYEGSLTTPSCEEAVIWTVFKEIQEISEKQLEQFRSVKETEDEGEEKLVNNFRPPQPLHGRVVEVSGEEESGAATSVLSLVALLLGLLMSARQPFFQ